MREKESNLRLFLGMEVTVSMAAPLGEGRIGEPVFKRSTTKLSRIKTGEKNASQGFGSMFEIEGTVTMTAPVVGYRGIEPRTGDAPEGLSPVASLA